MAIAPTRSSSRKAEHIILIGIYAHTDEIYLSVCTNMLGMLNGRTIHAGSTPALLSAWKLGNWRRGIREASSNHIPVLVPLGTKRQDTPLDRPVSSFHVTFYLAEREISSSFLQGLERCCRNWTGSLAPAVKSHSTCMYVAAPSVLPSKQAVAAFPPRCLKL